MDKNSRAGSMSASINSIPVIDLFAGPGGLGEGFSAYGGPGASFRIKLSIEKDPAAHKTLQLRSFFRQFPTGKAPRKYYDYVCDREGVTREDLQKFYPEEWKNACDEAWLAELGSRKFPEKIIDSRIEAALAGAKEWVLIGGPPCQAYSLVGRARMKNRDPEAFEKDHRHFLYRQYLRILRRFQPSIFVMENVKGLLSSKIKDQLIFHQILRDLKDEGRYTIYSLSRDADDPQKLSPEDFVIMTEKYGVPQSRHRLILLGIRNDSGLPRPSVLVRKDGLSVKDMLSGLPKFRSNVSRRSNNSDESWWEIVSDGAEIILNSAAPEKVKTVCRNVVRESYKTGWRSTLNGTSLGEWVKDEKLTSVLNHEPRAHMASDIQRYLFAACYADALDISPRLRDFPKKLLPKHKNLHGQEGSLETFADRFKVQVASKASSTIVSHIAKDGHYYIHPDPSQCRSLTVREAARLQTFPDNYFFEGNRTQQYTQVGNAVPPYLALQIAEITAQMIAGKAESRRSSRAGKRVSG